MMMIEKTVLILAGSVAVAIPGTWARAQEAKTGHVNCPMSSERRADEGMGFSQAKTTHHFTLKKTGGIISVSANDPGDTGSRDQIRMHLTHIAHAFAGGNFEIPMFVHDETPPGVSVMISKKDRIQYRFEPEELGGRVVITTSDAEALSAVHEFLRFQIRDHQTGDALEIR
jgi:hypothetical protein